MVPKAEAGIEDVSNSLIHVWPCHFDDLPGYTRFPRRRVVRTICEKGVDFLGSNWLVLAGRKRFGVVWLGNIDVVKLFDKELAREGVVLDKQSVIVDMSVKPTPVICS